MNTDLYSGFSQEAVQRNPVIIDHLEPVVDKLGKLLPRAMVLVRMLFVDNFVLWIYNPI